MFHDLNVPWTDATRELQRTVVFLDECEWNVILGIARNG
jgi:ribonuclease P/MRP protein subunit RPP1